MSKIVKEFLNEIKQYDDPLHSMGIGTRFKILSDLEKINVKESDVRIINNNIILSKNKYIICRNLRDIQMKYLNLDQREFVKGINSKIINSKITNLENVVKQAYDNIPKKELLILLDEFTQDKKVINQVTIYLSKYNRTKEEKKEDDENNTYVFIGYVDKVSIKIKGKNIMKINLK